MGNLKISGVDYSLTSPAICVHNGAVWKPENCQFYFFEYQKKRLDIDLPPCYNRYEYPQYESAEQRYDILSDWAMEIVKYSVIVGLEGYSMASKGKVFHIAENMGLLKWKMWRAEEHFIEIPPTTLKQYGACVGNATKHMMEVEFKNDTGINVIEDLQIGNVNGSFPHYDIVDAYWLCKYAHEQFWRNVNENE